MLPTAFQKMRANRGELKPLAAAPARADILRANQRKAGEASERALVRKINRIEAEMAAEWQLQFAERLAARARGLDDSTDRLRGWSEQTTRQPEPKPAAPRRWWPNWFPKAAFDRGM